MSNRLPSREVLRSWLTYDPISGEFRWASEPRPCRPMLGKIAGSLSTSTGYRLISVKTFGLIGAHRLAWIYVHGSIPSGMEIDHKDGNPSNNAIANLRLATSSQQKMNKGVQSNNRSGLKGAYFHACRKVRKWRSQIRVGGKVVFLGYYMTAEEAHEAYVKAAPLYYGDFARAA